MNFIWLGLVALLGFSQTTSGMVPPAIIKQCVASTQVQSVDLALFYGTDYLIVSQPVKCYITCLFETTGMALNGKISDEVAMMAGNPTEAEKLKELIAICNTIKAEGECEPTFQAYKCWLRKGKY